MKNDDFTKNVPPDIYTENYYLNDNEGFREYRMGVVNSVHPKFERALKFLPLKQGMNVLDLGCGRGEMTFLALQQGCHVTAVDYSDAAIQITKRTVSALPEQLSKRLRLCLMDATGLSGISKSPAEKKYDAVFLIDVVEHVYPWQLKEILGHLKNIMSTEGVLFISTPNLLYEKYFYVIKRVLNFPFTLLKNVSRVLRGKISLKEFRSHVFKISMHRNDEIDHMHVNVMSPKDIRKHLCGWRVKLVCDKCGGSKSFLDWLFCRWIGPEMIVCAKPPLSSNFSLFHDKRTSF